MATISNLIVNMIARTAGFEQPIKKAQKSFGDFQREITSSMRSVQTVLRLGILGRYVEGVIEGMTAYHKALREGTDATVAFAEALPLLGGIEKAFAGMYAEFTGLNIIIEQTDKALSSAKSFSKIMEGIREGLSLANTPLGEEPTKELKKYLKTLAEIQKEKDIFTEAQKSNKMLVAPNWAAVEAQALKLYNAELKKMNDELSKAKWKKEDNGWIDKANRIKEALKTPFEKFEDFADMMNNLFMKGLLTIDEWVKGIENGKKEMKGMERSERENNYQFQEVRPSLINLAALNPTQNQVVGRLDTLIGIERQMLATELS